jgi:hypothetical protein
MGLSNTFRCMLFVLSVGCPLFHGIQAHEGSHQFFSQAPILIGDINYGPVPEAEEGAEEIKSEQS